MDFSIGGYQNGIVNPSLVASDANVAPAAETVEKAATPGVKFSESPVSCSGLPDVAEIGDEALKSNPEIDALVKSAFNVPAPAFNASLFV